MGKRIFSAVSDCSLEILAKTLPRNFPIFSEKSIFQITSCTILLSFERFSACIKFAFTKNVHSASTNDTSINISYNQKHITN